MDNYWAMPFAEGWAVSRVGEGDFLAWYATKLEADRTVKTLAELDRRQGALSTISDRP